MIKMGLKNITLILGKAKRKYHLTPHLYNKFLKTGLGITDSKSIFKDYKNHLEDIKYDEIEEAQELPIEGPKVQTVEIESDAKNLKPTFGDNNYINITGGGSSSSAQFDPNQMNNPQNISANSSAQIPPIIPVIQGGNSMPPASKYCF